MPLFIFQCDCGSQLEVLQKYTDPSPTCRACAELGQDELKEMKRKVGLSSFSLKGDGWAKDNYGLSGA
jgi:predicted nucleic acid-binding Zn ribbon protein